jgi:hypothetical protein
MQEVIRSDRHGFRPVLLDMSQRATVEGAGDVVDNSVELVLVQNPMVLDGFQTAL